ncbi:AfsR/SARP family transcriptional regulator [Streptomyces sp. NPDC020965]|uniref:AfsR/SARP family transcriptional regulator n=1 Tax=Streptomyces sp. NPDC020965 TaxID=3365105 RepID=UPI0037A0D10A
MRISLLGPTQALHDDGTPVALGGARLRALLTILALRAGRPVPVDALIDEVWGAEPPADAVGAVQALVGRLRRALGREAVASAGFAGYRLGVDADHIDLYRFERLVADGARALEQGDTAKALALLDDALALWRGPVLADLPDRAVEAARWESRRLDARRTRLAAALALGRAEEALPELVALCQDHPIDESLQVLRLRALRATGRPAEALAAYETFRRELAERLGTDPGPGLRALHAELLSPDGRVAPEGAGPELNRTAASPTDPTDRTDRIDRTDRTDRIDRIDRTDRIDLLNRPAPPTTASAPAVPTAPVRLPADTESPARPATHRPAPATAPPTVAPAPPPGNLRARLTSFVGRERDIEAIRSDLRSARLVTLLGPGGAGKTRLSQEVAELVAAEAPDGVWVAELAPVDDPNDVPEAVLTALGARETVLRGAGAEEVRAAERSGDDPLVRLVEHCARRRMLILLDNCEHVVAAAATLAERLLESCPGLTVLATSREPLGVPGELVRPVEPLPAPTALRLLADRGAAARPGFRTDDDPDACAEICRRLDGLPLAIELAAARLRMLTPRQIADRLDDRFRLLTGGSRTVLPRQQTLRAVVDWSWDLLDAPERAVLRRLSVFSGGCDLAAAEAVCTEEGAEVADSLGGLIDRSLVVAAPDGARGMRYRLLETVAEYASARLDEAAERATVERRHLVHYRELARTTDPLLRGPDQAAAIELLGLEYENLRTALRHAIAADDEHEALQLVLSLSWYWQMRDLRSEARHWAAAACELGPDPFAPPYTPATPVFERFTDAPPPMSPELLLEARRGAALLRMVFTNYDIGNWHAPGNLERLRGITRVYRPGLPQTCRSPGTLWFFAVLMTGDVDAVRRMMDETVAACRRHGYEWELASALQDRANILANRGDWAGDARRDADEALEIFTRLGDIWGAAEALSARGEAHERRGAFASAAEDFTAAVAYAERIGAQVQVGVLRARLAGTLIELGEGERGEALLRQVLAENGTSDNESTAIARIYLTIWLGRTGRRGEARTEIARLFEQFRSSTLAIFEGMMTGYLAWLDLADGHHQRALDLAREALATAREGLSQMVAPQMVAAHLVTAAGALVGGWPERAADAVRMLAVADAQIPPAHFPTLYEREGRADVEAAVRAVLDAAAYDAAYADGGGLTVEEAAAL